MLKKLFGKLLKKEHESYRYEVLSQEEVVFHVEQDLFNKAESLEATEWLLHQHITLKMLVEQGLAEQIPNGFIVKSQYVCTFDDDTLTLLALPKKFTGSFTTDVRGEVRRANFDVDIKVHIDGIETLNWTLKGPILVLSESRKYTLNNTDYQALLAQLNHRGSEKNEFNNLKLIETLQRSKKDGSIIELSHFDKINVIKPDTLSVQAIQDSQGNLILSPNLGRDITPEDYHARKGQIAEGNSAALRSKNTIVLLDETTIEAAQEIIKNEFVPKEQVRAFLACPSAFLDASLVDLDMGFSLRVKGVTKFKHGYFAEQSESEIDWFGDVSEGELRDFSDIVRVIDSQEDLDLLTLVVDDAKATNSDIVSFYDKQYMINSYDEVNSTLAKAAVNLSNINEDESREIEGKKSNNETAVVDIDLNDEDVMIASPKLDGLIESVLFKGTLDWSNYKYSPFPHQDVGVRWLLGIKGYEVNGHRVSGALLADDMGLGKTFMGLAAIEQHYRLCNNKNEICKPALIVAPLSLLETWKAEVEKFFNQSPFHDIVILQSSGELNRFKIKGTKSEIKMQQFDSGELLDDSHIKYALKFGKYYGAERLDMPKRLVITTYQTLRDYQFSLCKVDWSFAIFDEAQNTKNPNALQTRAAKGLKADFKVMATGTPVENNLCDFWCLIDTAMPGYLGSYQDFKGKYVATSDNEEDKARLGRQLRLDVGPLMLRRLKEDNLENLPSKIVHVGIEGDDWAYSSTLSKPLQGEQLAAYDRAAASMEEGAGSALAVLLKLRNISLHHDLQHKERFEPAEDKNTITKHMLQSGKLESTIETLKAIYDKGEKVIIFAINKRLQSYLSVALGKIFGLGMITVINGDTKAVSSKPGVETRKNLIENFENKLGFNIIIMSPIAAGTGLTVIGANHVIHLERHWNPAKEAQATDRAYRIGQVKDVHVYLPILHHPNKTSFDLNLHHLLNSKIQIKDAVVTPEDVSMKASDWGLGE